MHFLGDIRSLKGNINNAMERKETKNQILHLRAWDRRSLPNHVSNLYKCTDYSKFRIHLFLGINNAYFNQ